ncbi:uncharacterized protein LOC114432486 [Parambassis ranga]|uniref:Uncharacterized protein LOC114432486 n=1 Tax=Parambassis ranga TaxID=210632 RepID=A0A6P7HW16_9TELE|nr:uncharacterized protein LOC114432486 [Parambassis ranga]
MDMSAPDAWRETRPSRNQDLQRPLRVLARPRHPVSTSTWLPSGRDSACRRPIFVSFVSKAILWDRGVCHYTVPERPVHRPSLCPRFLSHMKACPEDFRPPYFLSSKSKPQPLPQERTHAHTLTAPQVLSEGRCHFNPTRRRGITGQSAGLNPGRRSASIVVPCPQPPATPPPPTPSPSPSLHNTIHPESESKLNTVPASPPGLPLPHLPPPREKEEELSEREMMSQPAVEEQDWELNLECDVSTPSASPTSLSRESFSDLSRPASSLFSRSTDLASGRSSILCDEPAGETGRVSAAFNADIEDSDLKDTSCLSPLQPSPVLQLLTSPPTSLNPHQNNTVTTPPLYEAGFGQTKSLSPHLVQGAHPNSDKPLCSSRCTDPAENLQLDASMDAGLNPSDQAHPSLAFPSATWSSCPSPQRTTLRSGSGAKLTPSSPVSRLESQRWPVLPPISPVRGRSAASHSSELSCTQSCMFDELEAIAPLSTSCLSLDEPSDSSDSPSPDTALSPGLAALTVGCDSGNLGSLSRVQLLLLDRTVPENLVLEEEEEEFSPVEDWSDLSMDHIYPGVSRPSTAGSISERCDSTGEVQENKSDLSVGGSGSPSSWIIDQSPSFHMFRSSALSSHTDVGGLHEEESNYTGQGDQVELSDESFVYGADEKERRMEERKTQVLDMLSKLQDDTPRQKKSSKGRSNFEDFDFLAKYCIFSQEKLAEYKRAFEAEDRDGDGYISCVQVLLALKNILPPELLSDEEEIYVYRILEMVDFRVTDGLVDLRLFAVIASLAQKVACMDEFMRSLISSMDFRSLEVKLFKAKQLFLFLLEEQRGDAGAQKGFISAEQLLLELKAGGIHLEQEAAVRLELQRIPPLDLLDFLAYLPLFMLIHKSVISNPLHDSSNL